MASKHKHRPTLPTIPIITNNETVAQLPTHKGVAFPVKTASTKKPPEEDWSNVDPDDLFVRFTIPEIRNIQGKLRTDADAKQEELRLMVGERYRDLLRASTSIISIADSSKRVTNALTEMREAMTSDGSEQKPRRSSVRGKDDAHLKALQSLSAHLKLLLDAPEHLWRLLAKKQHLPAAWLFLLARVVHRALVTEDPEESWEHEGISVLSQFPLVQRQWETVAQFRSQIAHRATQYLREHPISSETACSTVLTLHLLDSLPLSETLSTLLSQRSRTLHNLFAQNLEVRSPSHPGSPISKSRRKNRELTDNLPSLLPITRETSQHGKEVVNVVRFAVLEVLDIITGTVQIARDVFRAEGDRKSLVERSLEDIQSDTPPSSVLTTSTLLSTPPSSTHLLTLPQPILSYKPYIDMTSPSAHVDPAILDTKLSGWFDKAIQGLEGRIHAWFEGLETIREVWGVRRKVLQKLEAGQGLEEREKMRIQSILDGGVKDRVGDVTRSALQDVEKTVGAALRRAVQDVKDDIEDTRLDVSPSEFLFSPPPIPFVSQLPSNTGITVASFKSFKTALRQRADGRTPSLDRFLSDIESRAGELHQDLEIMKEDDHISRDLERQVMNIYYPEAQSALTRIIEIIEGLISPENTDGDGKGVPAKSITVIIFLGRISHSMASSSFGESLRCKDDALQGFREALNALHERSLTCWSTHAVSKALEQYSPVIASLKHTHSVAPDFTWPSQPTPHLISSLLSLTSSLQHLGLPRTELHSKRIAIGLVYDFKASIASEIPSNEPVWRQELAQLLWDLTFLRQLTRVQGGGLQDSDGTEDALTMKVALLQSQLRPNAQEETFSQFSAHVDRTIDHYLLRCQTLLAPLTSTSSPSKDTVANGHVEHDLKLGSKATVLLPFGTSTADQDFKPAMEVAKPSARFGLLLAGSTTIR